MTARKLDLDQNGLGEPFIVILHGVKYDAIVTAAQFSGKSFEQHADGTLRGTRIQRAGELSICLTERIPGKRRRARKV